MSLAEFGGSEVVLRDSPAESARFGLRIDRLVVPERAPLDAVRGVLAGSDADVVIARYPAARLETARILWAAGRTTIPAGTLMYWRADPGGTVRPGPDARFSTGGVTAGDEQTVADLIARAFAGYRNHYAADPLLDPAHAATGYVEWATTTALAGDATTVLREGGEAIGIATVTARDDEWEIELAGIVPEHQGRGRYAHLLDGVHRRAVEAGARSVVISTQASHSGVQRAWARAGYLPVGAVETVHLVRSALLRS